METRDHENSTLAFLPDESTLQTDHKDQLRERIKIEFYKTYDVMTGIRIAATLGGFFSMMILLVLYKNYCKPSKTLSEEQLNAAVTAAAEEEDRALQAALEATSFYTALDKRRQSIENTSQILLSPRFSSVGGGYSHLTPPLKASTMQQRGKSLPGSVLQFGATNSPSSFPKDDRASFIIRDNDLDKYQTDLNTPKNHVNVTSSRRVSSVTCFSTDSSYLERRCSAFEMGVAVAPHFLRHSRENLLGQKEPPWDYYYPIDIQVIQPTPEMSPTASVRNLNDDYTICGLQVPGIIDQTRNLSMNNSEIALAPLASISSLGGFSQSSSITSKSINTSASYPIDNQDKSIQDSIGSDSVFMDVDELATDSEFEYDGFDDDYSFCESKSPRHDLKNLKFASFDSCETSINQDDGVEIDQEETGDQKKLKSSKISILPFVKQKSTDIKRHPSLQESSKIRRKLVKTYSEPRTRRFSKALPPWTENGRSTFVPRRQMSSPSRKKNDREPKRTSQSSPKHFFNDLDQSKLVDNLNTNNDKDKKFLLSESQYDSSNITLVPVVQRSDSSVGYSSQIQGLDTDLPSKTHQKSLKQLSLPSTQERRNRLQKQKNITEEIKMISNLPIEEKTDTGADAEISKKSKPVTPEEHSNMVPVTLTGTLGDAVKT